MLVKENSCFYKRKAELLLYNDDCQGAGGQPEEEQEDGDPANKWNLFYRLGPAPGGLFGQQKERSRTCKGRRAAEGNNKEY